LTLPVWRTNVVPLDGVYLFGAQMNIKDDSVIQAKFTVQATNFTVNTGTDEVTATGHGYRTGVEVRFTSTGTLPAGLVSNGRRSGCAA
jgi:hypothetical protein